MFIAHFGVGFGAKAAAPRVSLGSLFLAAQFIDLIWPTLLLLGIERVNIITDGSRHPPLDFVYYPYSHSLLAVVGWAVLFAAAYFIARRNRIGAFVLGLAVISHWLLDLVVHYPDLPLYPGNSMLLGFSIWSSPLIALVLEIAIFAAGVRLYLRSTNAIDAIGKWSLWSLVAALLVIQIGNVFGAPPPSATAIAWVGQAQWLLVAWGYWVDRHRHPVAGRRQAETRLTQAKNL
jgi:membrane-bound metal-dependent hydrolase YbcI (DUF457 family)